MRALRQQPNETNREYSMRVLRQSIIALEVQPGRMYSEKELSTLLGLPRTPMREALIELSKTRIVEVYPQRGTAVSLIDYDLVEEACFMREALETEVIARCCERPVDAQQLARMELNVRQQRSYRDACHADTLMLLDNSFHKMLFDLTGMRASYEMLSSMTIHFDRVRTLAVEGVSDFCYIDDHEGMLEAIRTHDAEKARALMHRHMHRYEIDAVSLRRLYPDYFADANRAVNQNV